MTATGNVNTGVDIGLPLNGDSSVEGPTQRYEEAWQIAEEAARVDLEIKRAELREALADAQLAEARAEAEILAIKAQHADIEGVEW